MKLGGRHGKKLLRFVLSVPLAALAILVVYALASLADGSLASLSAPLEAAVIVAVLAVVVLGRALLSRRDAKERSRVEAAQSAAAADTRAVSWPPGKVTTNGPAAERAPVAARMLTAPTVRDPATLPPAISGPIRRAAESAPLTRVATPPTIAAPAPVARKTSDVPARPSLEQHGSGSETVTAAHTPREANALTEYLSGREELATLIADVEARMPNGAQTAPVVQAAPVVEPEAPGPHESRVEREARIEREARVESMPPATVEAPVTVDFEPVAAPAASVEPELAVPPEPQIHPVAAAEAESEPESVLAQNTLVLARAIEEVTRASELIARACDLFADRSEADRAELRALTDAVLTLAQTLVPTPSTPRLVGGSVFATPARPREHEIVIDDERSDASAPASASSSGDQTRSSPTRPAAATPRPSNWSAAQAPSTPPTSLQPKPPPAPGSRSGR